MVERLFLTVPRACLQFVIVVFPDHTHLLFLFKIMPLGPKMAPSWGHVLYIGLYSKKHENIFLTETIWPRVLIIGMMYHLVDLYEVCLNYPPGTKNGPTLEAHVLHRLI